MRYGALIKLEQEYIDILRKCIDRKEVANTTYYEEFLSNSAFVYLGEVVQMPGHIICAGKNGKVYFGFHDDDFRELTDDEA